MVRERPRRVAVPRVQSLYLCFLGLLLPRRVFQEQQLRVQVHAHHHPAHDGQVGVRQRRRRLLLDVHRLEILRDALDVAHALDRVPGGHQHHGVARAQAAQLLCAARARDAGADNHAGHGGRRRSVSVRAGDGRFGMAARVGGGETAGDLVVLGGARRVHKGDGGGGAAAAARAAPETAGPADATHRGVRLPPPATARVGPASPF